MLHIGGPIRKRRYISGEVRRPPGRSVFALFCFLILCFGVGILIHMLTDYIGFFPWLKGDKSRLVKGSISVNMERFESENTRRVISVIERYNRDMDPQLKWGIAHEINNMTMRYPNLDIDLICSIITYCSRKTWYPQIFSSTGALGLMQIPPGIGKFFARYEGIVWTTEAEILLNPIYNIRIGVRYLSTLVGQYGLEDGLAVYLMGQKERRWGGKMHTGVHYRRLKKTYQGVRDGKTM